MSDKLISANKLMEYINGSIEAMTKVGVAVDGEYLWGLINYALEDAPTIEAEPVRHGKWTRDYESSWGDSRFMCSVCHCKESVPTCNGEPSIWDYCPNCGAKMNEVTK